MAVLSSKTWVRKEKDMVSKMPDIGSVFSALGYFRNLFKVSVARAAELKLFMHLAFFFFLVKA